MERVAGASAEQADAAAATDGPADFLPGPGETATAADSSDGSGGLMTFFRAGSTDIVRHLVSKKKNRYVRDGYDLDLTYITPRLIAMGFPSTGAEALYRNPATQVKSFLAHYHPQQCKVYNLCVESNRQYQASVIGLPDALLEVHATYDHNPCPLICVLPFCKSVDAWLAESTKVGRAIAIDCH